jgi:hypothetical protein
MVNRVFFSIPPFHIHVERNTDEPPTSARKLARPNRPRNLALKKNAGATHEEPEDEGFEPMESQ